MHNEFEVAGNIGVFAQNDEEYSEFSKIAKALTKLSDNPNQKYFELINPIVIKDGPDSARFTHLYVRKFDPTEYGKNLGDVDFVTDKETYLSLKEQVQNNHFNGATMYDRPGWDTIQIVQASVNVIAYLSTKEMAEKVRVKFDNLTNL